MTPTAGDIMRAGERAECGQAPITPFGGGLERMKGIEPSS